MADVSIETLIMGPIENNVYIIGDGTATFVVDPTCEPERILNALGDRTLDAIVITHGHYDHVNAAKALRDATGAPVIASAADVLAIEGKTMLGAGRVAVIPCPVDRQVDDGDIIEIGTMKWQVIMTPGHTPGSMCLLCETGDAPILISGDTLFAGAHGRTDFIGSDPAAMRTSLARLAQLPDETIVLPGHNASTTIARERPWMN